jgi:septal ring factor EnvC (AmiA/AmiB activator)
MTNEEIEKTIAFTLEQQAQLTATVGRLAEKVEQIAEKVDRTANSVTALLAIAEIHEREIEALKDGQAETGEKLNALINTVERFISERRNGEG